MIPSPLLPFAFLGCLQASVANAADWVPFPVTPRAFKGTRFENLRVAGQRVRSAAEVGIRIGPQV